MLRQALEHFARLEIESLRAHLAGVLGNSLSRHHLVDEFTAMLLPQLGADSWRTVAQYALYQEAFREPELADVCREWTQAWEAALAEVFTSLGAPEPELEGRMFLAMLDGLLLNQLAAPDRTDEESLIRSVLDAWFARVPTKKSETERKSS